MKQLPPLKFKQQLEDMEGIDSGSQVRSHDPLVAVQGINVHAGIPYVHGW